MKTEITDIRTVPGGYRLDFNRQDGLTNTTAVNVLVSIKELIDYVISQELNWFEIYIEEDIDQICADPETFVNENYQDLLQQYLS